MDALSLMRIESVPLVYPVQFSDHLDFSKFFEQSISQIIYEISWSNFFGYIFKMSVKLFCFKVADAVAKGDSERAANAVIATAKAVDEVVAFSKARASITSESNGAPPNAQAKPKQVQSTMCIMI